MKKILVIFCIVFLCVYMVNSHFNKTQSALANGVIRFHVIANSNSPEDQALKIKIRDKIISKMEPVFNKNEDLSVARTIITDNIKKIKEIAKSEVIANGYNYDVNVSLEKDSFPTKDYGDIVLPAGEYEALKIEIGNACGQNWWCVLFPPLCFVDESCVSYSSAGAQKIISNVGQKNAPLIKKDKSIGYKIKFKSYEIWQTGKQTLAYLFGIK